MKKTFLLIVSSFILLTGCKLGSDKEIPVQEISADKVLPAFEVKFNYMAFAKSRSADFVENIILPEKLAFNARELFYNGVNGEEIRATGDFDDVVYPRMKLVPTMPKQDVLVYRFTKRATVANLAKEVGARPMTMNEFLQTAFTLMCEPPKEGSATLLKGAGGWNLFLVEVLPGENIVTYVSWDKPSKSWGMGTTLACTPDMTKWGPSNQIFLHNGFAR